MQLSVHVIPIRSRSTMWENWKKGTRFFRSARIAFEREKNLWDNIELKEPESSQVHDEEGGSSYSVSVSEHVEVMRDLDLLYTAVLIYSYSIVESEAADQLGEEIADLGGIEDWGERLLRQNDMDWGDVWGGREGIVEVAVVRNIFAHGKNVVDERSYNRLQNVGCDEWDEGDVIDLDFEMIRVYRNCLRSLLRLVDDD